MIMSEKRLQEYINSSSMFSAAIVNLKKTRQNKKTNKQNQPNRKAITKKPLQNPSPRAVPAVTVSAKKILRSCSW